MNDIVLREFSNLTLCYQPKIGANILNLICNNLQRQFVSFKIIPAIHGINCKHYPMDICVHIYTQRMDIDND